MNNRRNFFRKTFGFGAGIASAKALVAQNTRSGDHVENIGAPVLVETPDLKDLPFTLDNGVKVFHLIAEPVKQEVAPNKTLDLWGFNGSAPGPTIQVIEGDRVLIEKAVPTDRDDPFVTFDEWRSPEDDAAYAEL